MRDSFVAIWGKRSRCRVTKLILQFMQGDDDYLRKVRSHVSVLARFFSGSRFARFAAGKNGMGTLQNSTEPEALANAAKHFAFHTLRRLKSVRNGRHAYCSFRASPES